MTEQHMIPIEKLDPVFGEMYLLLVVDKPYRYQIVGTQIGEKWVVMFPGDTDRYMKISGVVTHYQQLYWPDIN